MTDVLTLSDSQILAINKACPEKLFSGEESAAKNELRRLRSKWHPDRASTADVDRYEAVTRHVNILYDIAIEMLSNGTWRGAGQLLIDASDGRQYKFKYLRSDAFELGNVYLGASFIVYFIVDEYADLVRIAQDHMEKNFKFADGPMEMEHRKSLPRLTNLIQAKKGYYIVLSKDPAYIRLSDVLEHFDGKLDERHAAWIVSRLYNLSCYLKLAGLVHADIAPRNIFINPAQHYAALYGGWWYARRENERLVALPPRTIAFGPALRDDKTATASINSELIKATGRECLGDIVGSKLLTMKYPQALVSWLRSPGGDRHPFDEYSTWLNQVLKNSYGARKFVELKLQPEDVYSKR